MGFFFERKTPDSDRPLSRLRVFLERGHLAGKPGHVRDEPRVVVRGHVQADAGVAGAHRVPSAAVRGHHVIDRRRSRRLVDQRFAHVRLVPELVRQTVGRGPVARRSALDVRAVARPSVPGRQRQRHGRGARERAVVVAAAAQIDRRGRVPAEVQHAVDGHLKIGRFERRQDRHERVRRVPGRPQGPWHGLGARGGEPVLLLYVAHGTAALGRSVIRLAVRLRRRGLFRPARGQRARRTAVVFRVRQHRRRSRVRPIDVTAVTQHLFLGRERSNYLYQNKREKKNTLAFRSVMEYLNTLHLTTFD